MIPLHFTPLQSIEIPLLLKEMCILLQQKLLFVEYVLLLKRLWVKSTAVVLMDFDISDVILIWGDAIKFAVMLLLWIHLLRLVVNGTIWFSCWLERIPILSSRVFVIVLIWLRR